LRHKRVGKGGDCVRVGRANRSCWPASQRFLGNSTREQARPGGPWHPARAPPRVGWATRRQAAGRCLTYNTTIARIPETGVSFASLSPAIAEQENRREVRGKDDKRSAKRRVFVDRSAGSRAARSTLSLCRFNQNLRGFPR